MARETKQYDPTYDGESGVNAAIKAGIEIGEQYGTVTELGKDYDPIVVFRGESGPVVVNMKDYERKQPNRIVRRVAFTCPKSFAQYVTEFKDVCGTRVYCDVMGQTFTAILDDHAVAPTVLPAWCDHTAVYAPMATEAWNAWKRANGALMSQVEFAEFVEERLEDIKEPEGAKMLMLAKNLQAQRSLRFRSGVHLGNGQVQFEYVEETQSGDATGGKQSMTAPEYIKVRLTPFMGGSEYDFKAAFRYRIGPEGLRMGYSIFHLEAFQEQYMAQIAADIAKELEGVPVLMGVVR